MSELSRPSTIIGGANVVATAAVAIYLANKNSALNARVNDLTDDVDTIRDGIKEKVPQIENSIKGLDQNMRSIANAVHNNLGPVIKRTDKSEKKLTKYRAVIEEMGEAIEMLENRYNTLIKAMSANSLLKDVKLEELPDRASMKPKKVPKRKKSYEFSSSESESESSSEDEKPKSKKNKNKNKNKNKVRMDDADESDTNIVARMASRKN